jgi:outer membrane protein OmpA-like peptidoglycan-associated protein
MKRIVALAPLVLMLLAGPVLANDLTGRWGVGTQLGLQKMIGGEHDYSNADQDVAFWLRNGLNPNWSLEMGLRYGWVRPGALSGEDAGLTFDSVHAYYTTTMHGLIGFRRHFGSESSFVPYMGLYAGYLDWRVRDENGTDGVGLMPDGEIVHGYDAEGRSHPLHGQNFTGTLGLGVEWFVGENSSLDLGARYSRIIDNDLDTIGSGNLWGAEEVDANDGILEAYVGFAMYWGGDKDKDDDGILDDADLCPDVAEDFDSWQDTDGCPEPDNDSDGIGDTADGCPNDAEDRDGFRDEDGCPDPDNDADGVFDAKDKCPDQAEDPDGFQDADGCPDPDNDGDGVNDAADTCPDTPAGVKVDKDGCPLAAEIKAAMTLKGVRFKTGSAVLDPVSVTTLEEVAASLKAWPMVRVEVQGHTDNVGAAEANRNLSAQRAEAVRQYLIGAGVEAGRMTAVGYGEDLPVADNTTDAGRQANRRVDLVRTDR